MVERWPEGVWDYITEHTRFQDPLLKEMEARAERDGFPIIGPLVGPWLYFYTRLICARHVFEMGAGFGYSTWYFARALKDSGGGCVVHTVWDEALSAEAQGWMERAGLLTCCDFRVSESILALVDCQPGFDIIFLDIDKEGYLDALSVIEEKLRPGGLLLIDNTLWDGRVLDPKDESEATRVVRKLNATLHDSAAWDYLISPLRDGLGVARLRE